MTDTINNVPRELLERVLNAGWGSETVNALDDLRDFLESAPSHAGKDAKCYAGVAANQLRRVASDLRRYSSAPEEYRNERALNYWADSISSVVARMTPDELEGWRPVPIANLQNILMLIDPEPVRLPTGETMVFRNPIAAEMLTRISAEVRAMLEVMPSKVIP